MDTVAIILIVFGILVLLILASCVKIVPQAHAYIVERLGDIRQHGMWVSI